VAFDAVCCQIIGIDPLTVEHIRLAHERGFGPVSLDEIDIVGDVSLAEAQARADGFRVGLIRVEDYFADTNIRAYGGRPPSDGDTDYCWGGCPGALEEAIEILRLADAATDEKMPRLHVIFGKYDDEIEVHPGEKVIFMGDCAEFHGELGGQLVDVKSLYVDRSEKAPRGAKGQDIFLKIFKTSSRLRNEVAPNVIRISGCPVSVAEQVLVLVKLAKLRNPYFDPTQALPFTSCYLSMRTRQAIKRVFGKKYNLAGPTPRGDARPALNAPPDDHALPLEVQ
jgi:hypothetical protein